MHRFTLIILFLLLSLSATASISTRLFTTLYQDARLSDAAYRTNTEINALVVSMGYRLDASQLLKNYNVAYYIATNHQTRQQIITVRGTTGMENAMINMSVNMQLDAHLNIRLHEGFSKTAAVIYADIKPLLKKNYAVSVTGHSLGGAVALIVAMHLSQDGFNVKRVTTFAQPKVTDIYGARKFKHLNIIRVITERDMIPLLPPFNYVDLNRADIYWHLGNEILIYEDERYSQLSPLDGMLRALSLFAKTSENNIVQQHYITYYLRLIKQKLNRASLVPYKTAVNPLDWFL